MKYDKIKISGFFDVHSINIMLCVNIQNYVHVCLPVFSLSGIKFYEEEKEF